MHIICLHKWFGANGKAIWDRDFVHADPSKTLEFPHDHDWDWNRKIQRGIDHLQVNEEFC